MAGGIQPGTVAWDQDSLKMDKFCREARNILVSELCVQYEHLVCKIKLEKEDIPGGVGGCSPDGGAWFYNGKLICVFEGKKQQNAGNAIERWYKNNYICRTINPDVSYITFACGEGVIEEGVIQKTLNIAHLDGGVNTYIPSKNSVYYSVNGFELSQVVEIMKEVILERIVNAEN